MTEPRPSETTEVHTRLMKCTIEADDARAYWERATPGEPATAEQAFSEYWFGAKSLPRVKVLLTNFRARFDAFPEAFEVLHRWRHMDPVTRTLVGHWHLQLTDPLYRRFTGDYLVGRHLGFRADITRDLVVAWVGDQGPGRWTMSTRIQFASKLLSGAFAVGLVTGKRDPRPLAFPRVPDAALTYAVYLLRGVDFEGTLLDNPYLRSLGLDGAILEDRLEALPAVGFRRQGDLLDYGWRYPSLAAWGEHAAGSP